MVEAFPGPGRLTVMALQQLEEARTAVPTQRAAMGDLSVLPRPWDPAGCPAPLRGELWRWLEQVAAWVNREHGWQPDRVIPPCWPQHPHLVHELAVLACLRHVAGQALIPEPLEDWHRNGLAGFLDRLGPRLGTGCPPGRHTDWPAAGRYRDYLSEDAAGRRRDVFTADTATAARQHTPADPRAAATAGRAGLALVQDPGTDTGEYTR